LIDGKGFATIPAYLEKDGLMKPVTAENFTIEAVEIPELKPEEIQALKTLKLKQAENAFLSIVMQVPNVAVGDNSDVLTAKIESDTTMNETQKLSLGLKLLNAIHEVELQGGSWYDLPSVPHVIEVTV
jgi:hypothetical protein